MDAHHSRRGSRPRGGPRLRRPPSQEVRLHQLPRRQGHPDVRHPRRGQTLEVGNHIMGGAGPLTISGLKSQNGL